MNLTSLSIAARLGTEVETKALALWSASLLPSCRIWTARRGLQPPTEVLKTLQDMRFALPSLPESLLDTLLTASPDNGHNGHSESIAQFDRRVEELATDLSDDLRQLQELVSHTDFPDREQGFVTESRDLRRFQRVMAQHHLTQVDMVEIEPIIVTLFSPQRATLYIPRWLITALPRTLFEPDPLFYRARPASLAWLLLDAIVVTTTNEFKTI